MRIPSKAPAVNVGRGFTGSWPIRALAAAGAFSLLAAGVPCGRAVAHERDFPFTYDWFQTVKGEKEIELHSRYRRRDNSFQQQIEFELGVTDRFSIAPYVVFGRPEGSNRLKYEAWKLETRYQLGTFQLGRILPGLYLEYEKPEQGDGKIEAKLILSRYDRQGGNLSFNYIIERELEHGAEWEHEYSVAYARPLGTGRSRVRGGAEWIHNLESGRINAGPVVGFTPGPNTWIVAGYAFPLNNREGNGGEFRLVTEFTW